MGFGWGEGVLFLNLHLPPSTFHLSSAPYMRTTVSRLFNLRRSLPQTHLALTAPRHSRTFYSRAQRPRTPFFNTTTASASAASTAALFATVPFRQSQYQTQPLNSLSTDSSKQAEMAPTSTAETNGAASQTTRNKVVSGGAVGMPYPHWQRAFPTFHISSLYLLAYHTLAVSAKTSQVIIGSGPAGHTAAIYLARADLNPVLFEVSPFHLI